MSLFSPPRYSKPVTSNLMSVSSFKLKRNFCSCFLILMRGSKAAELAANLCQCTRYIAAAFAEGQSFIYQGTMSPVISKNFPVSAGVSLAKSCSCFEMLVGGSIGGLTLPPILSDV